MLSDMAADSGELQVIVERLVRLAADRKTVVVGIDGCGGSGKSTLAGNIARSLRARSVGCSIVHGDDFYLPAADRDRDASRASATEPVHGSAFDLERLRTGVLEPLAVGRDASYRRYDWGTDALAEVVSVPADGVVLVEGVYVTRSDLATRYDLTIWVECPSGLRLARGVARDGEADRRLWTDVWMPAEDEYVRAERPRDRSDYVVRGYGGSTSGRTGGR